MINIPFAGVAMKVSNKYVRHYCSSIRDYCSLKSRYTGFNTTATLIKPFHCLIQVVERFMIAYSIYIFSI